MKETSLFHQYGNFELVKLNIRDKKWEYIPEWKEDLECGVGAFGLAILKTLNRYQILNRYSLLRSVQTYHPNRWKQGRLSYVLKTLRKARMLELYEMQKETGDEQSLIVYILTKEAETLLLEKEIYPPGSVRGVDCIHKTKEALRWLSINQYHINLLYVLGKNLLQAYYNSFSIESRVIPSFVRYRMRSEKNRTFQKMNLFAVAAAKNEMEIEDLAYALIDIYEFLIKYPKYRPALIIVICENLQHAAWISWQLNKIRQMRPLCSMLYSLDITTMRDNMLSMLYTCDADETGIIRNCIDLQ